MNRGVLKITAFCLAGSMTFAGNGLISMAAGFDTPLAGIAQLQDLQGGADSVKEEPSAYDTIAIAQVDEYVNIRDQADKDKGKTIGKLYNNSAAEILGKDGDWYLIKSGEVTGYVKAEFFVTGQKAKALAEDVGREVATVNTTTLMVRAEADKDADILALVGDRETLPVISDEGDWVKVAVDSDVVGYVAKDYVERKTQFVEAESSEKIAERTSAVKAANDKAQQMREAAIAAMNSASADEAAYAAEQASAAAAEAKMLAAQQPLDYDIQDLASNAVAAANESAYASHMAAEAEAMASAEAQAAAEAQAQADAAAQAAADAQATADAQQSSEAQAQADAAAQAAADAQAQADAAAQAAAAQAAADAQQSSETTTNNDEGSSSTSDSSGTSSTRQSVVNFALQFIGNPYVWGGTSLTNGADCSGFTQSVMANFGIGIPRTAGAQSASGRAVDLGSIQPGDLLFYSGSGDYGIGHVTMYIGNGQVVHASSSTTGIIVSSMGYRTPCAARSYID